MPQSSDKKDLALKESTVIFIDWDDTLLCSSYLSNAGYRLDTELEPSSMLDRELKDLEASVIALLKLAMTFGDVHVVTNAETGWVQLSAKKFIPGVISVLEQIKVISARSTYESLFPDAPVKWKFCAFQEKLCSDLKSAKNVISFGDSHVEREAVRAVTRGLPNTRTKSVKFAEKPSMEQLRRQLDLVTSCFQYIHSHEGDLDLQLTVTVNTQQSSSDVGGEPSEQDKSSSSDANSNDSNTIDNEKENECPPLAQDTTPTCTMPDPKPEDVMAVS